MAKKKVDIQQSNSKPKRVVGIPFKKGVSGNPNGRPKKENTYSDTLKDILSAQKVDVELTINGKKKKFHITSNKNIYYGIASAQIKEALNGDTRSAKEIIDRVQGKSHQTIEQSGGLELRNHSNLSDKDIEKRLKQIKNATKST